MTNSTLAIILGGIIPAFGFGIYAILQKVAICEGIGIGQFLVFAGIGVIITGVVFFFLLNNRNFSIQSISMSAVTGIIWAVSTGLILFALLKYNANISKLVPLFNMNTLVAVVLGLIIFSEWKEVNSVKLLISSILIIIGGTLAANA